MNVRRYTRLTLSYSKTYKHHAAMTALFVAWYNFCRRHETLGKMTPAMASGLTYHVWTLKELLNTAKYAMKFSIRTLLVAQAAVIPIIALTGDTRFWSAVDDHRDIIWMWAVVMGPLFVVYVLSPLALSVVIGIEFIVNAVRVRFLDKKNRQ